ncbi:MAG: Holliday junction branch migration protein RuvA, partial [Deltaproteobacteria bacterium]|nr:Holliday junction branch migration protein RuvA [Deltaproteobacteria bacterium]
PEINEEVILETRLILREESVELFGFFTKAEKESFDILTSISKIGPRLALTIISAIDPQDLARAVMDQDIARLSAIKGIGQKTAERILVELKDKAKKLEGLSSSSSPEAQTITGTIYSEAMGALTNLGYKHEESERALKRASRSLGADPTLENLLREALKSLGP